MVQRNLPEQMINARAFTSLPSAATNLDEVPVFADDNGRLVTVNAGPRDIVGFSNKSLSVSTTKTLAPAGGAGVFRDLLSVTISNPSSASEAVVVIYANIASGAEVFKLTIPVAAGPQQLTFPTPLPAPTANVAWGIKSTVVGTTVTTQYVDNN